MYIDHIPIGVRRESLLSYWPTDCHRFGLFTDDKDMEEACSNDGECVTHPQIVQKQHDEV